jgi:hypothetical protein
MSILRLRIQGWEDGEPVERWLERPDRWALHSADTVTLVVDDWEVTINQRVCVGGGVWRGVTVLAWVSARRLSHTHTTPHQLLQTAARGDGQKDGCGRVRLGGRDAAGRLPPQ